MNTGQTWNLALRNTALPTCCRVQNDDNRPTTAVSPSLCEFKTEVMRENGRALAASFAHADSAVVCLYHSSPETHPRTVKCGAPGELNSPISLQCAAINRSQCWPSPTRMTFRFWSLPDMYWLAGRDLCRLLTNDHKMLECLGQKKSLEFRYT